ncbi:HpcH/HpaI aldolase/citrate lyase family protein [Clostridium polynesiense]|uniref:HpcH/HpaI aldolase/citrate lyase family protein n=1 Tax=Clostridium polynesiense TaxID=1325933 RepID=UPI00058DD52A|nr:aldolase/citrate lyase family protein [Clostridium polynesiense]
MLRRSLLFLPGNNPGMLQTASILGADGVILDLEDAVSLTEKDSARILVREAIKNMDFSEVELFIRINPMDGIYGEEDIRTVAPLKPDTLLIAKADEESLIKASSLLDSIEEEYSMEKGSIKLMALIETAYGVENVYSIIKSSDRVNGVLFGAEDYTADLGIKRTKVGEEIFYARNKIATACRALKISSIDTPFTDTEDYQGLKQDTLNGKRLGMTGKAAINPRQIESIHEVFAPSQDEINYALRVLNAVEKAEKEGKGVFALDGKMVDAPIIARARNTAELAKTLGLI